MLFNNLSGNNMTRETVGNSAGHEEYGTDQPAGTGCHCYFVVEIAAAILLIFSLSNNF